ncbi:MAG TPA: CBS domain-containing protein [Caldilineae bacterium]|nr:CBS domain-containing protein [Caldilineae bacterium]
MTSHLLIVILSHLEQVPQLMDAWEKAGVPGITIVDSVGGFRARSWLERSGLPLPTALRNLFQAEEVRGRILLAAIDDEHVLERAIAEAERVTGGFDRPHGGLLLALPVGIAKGIRKRAPAPPEQRPPMLAPMGPRTITRHTPISEVARLTPVIVHEEDTLDEAARAMIQHPDVHCACVVNDENQLVGVLPLSTVAEDVFLHIIPEEFLSHVTNWNSVADFAQRSRVRRVREAMLPPVWVKLDDTVEDAFRKIHELGVRELQGLPVVDDNYRVVGYVNLLGLLRVWLSAQEEQEARDQKRQERTE